MAALEYAVSLSGNGSRFRIADLLLLMAHVRYVSNQGVAVMFQLKNETEMPLLLQEMLTKQVLAQHFARQMETASYK